MTTVLLCFCIFLRIFSAFILWLRIWQHFLPTQTENGVRNGNCDDISRHKYSSFTACESQAQGVNTSSFFHSLAHSLTRSRCCFPFFWYCSIPNAKISGAMVDGHKSISNMSTKKKSRTQQQTIRRKKWRSPTRNPLHDLCCKKCVTFLCR